MWISSSMNVCVRKYMVHTLTKRKKEKRKNTNERKKENVYIHIHLCYQDNSKCEQISIEILPEVRLSLI